jgi:hypothetical protein
VPKLGNILKKLLDKLKEKRYSIYMMRSIFLIIGIFTIISCGNTEKDLGNITEEINSVSINDISNYLNENRKKLFDNEFFSDEQKLLFNKRLDYFIAILNNNEEIKMNYYEYVREYSRSSRRGDISYYLSKDIFDNELFELLEKEFGEIELPMKYLHEYYVNWHIFIRE